MTDEYKAIDENGQDGVKCADDSFNFYPNDNQCLRCGCNEYIYSAFVNGGGTIMVKRRCLNCGHADFIRKIPNENKRGTNQQSKWSQSVRERDGNKCVICHTDKNLHAHHIIPVSKDKCNKYIFDINNGITLCKYHHNMAHGEWMRKINAKADVDFNVVDIAREQLQIIFDEEMVSLMQPFSTADLVDIDYYKKDNTLFVKIVYARNISMMHSKIMDRKRNAISSALKKRMEKYIEGCTVDISVVNLYELEKQKSERKTKSDKIISDCYDVFGREKIGVVEL